MSRLSVIATPESDPLHVERHRPRRIMLIAMLSVLATVAAACGGSGSNGGSGDAGGSAGDPLPMGDPTASAFTYSIGLTDPATVLEGTLLGLVETDTSSFNSETGRCLVLLGVVTATDGPDSQNANGYLLPLSADADGGFVYPDDNKCDTDAIRGKGYDWLINDDAPIGADFAFFIEFFLPGDGSADLDSVVLGNPVGNSRARFYEPTIITDIPNPPA